MAGRALGLDLGLLSLIACSVFWEVCALNKLLNIPELPFLLQSEGPERDSWGTPFQLSILWFCRKELQSVYMTGSNWFLSTLDWSFRGGGLVANSCLTLAIPWTVACQAPLSVGFSRQEYWSGLLFPSPGDLPDPGIESGSPALQADDLPTELWGKPLDTRTTLQVNTKEYSFHVFPLFNKKSLMAVI